MHAGQIVHLLTLLLAAPSVSPATQPFSETPSTVSQVFPAGTPAVFGSGASMQAQYRPLSSGQRGSRSTQRLAFIARHASSELRRGSL